MTPADYAVTALALWREARGEGTAGITAVACVIRNRVNRHGSTPFAQVVKPWAFSSITAKGDPELTLWPTDADPQWIECQSITSGVLDGTIDDTTGGSTLYYAPKSIKTTATIQIPTGVIPWPQDWNQSAVTYSCTIGNQVFFVEK